MAIKPIVQFPHHVLSTPCLPIILDDEPPSINRVALPNFDDLIDTLEAREDGLALAANQIGLNYRAFSVDTTNEELGQAGDLIRQNPVVINPTFLSKSRETVIDLEGCLSIPGIKVPVARAAEIEVRWHAFSGFRATLGCRLSGLAARMFQHECDHLDGKTILSHLPRKEFFNYRALLLKKKLRGERG
jgi:peptide deformylase